MPKDQTEEDYTIAVNFGSHARSLEFRCNHLYLRVGDSCIVDTDRGPNIGVVTRARMKAAGKRHCTRLRNVIRKATKKDKSTSVRLKEREKEIQQVVRNKVAENELKMKLSNVELTFDEKRIIIYFTAEDRVDFRDMVKSLSQELDLKVEMRQMGTRDESKILGGCGICGYTLCCSSFLQKFAPISIRMAKNQNLSLNPAKISGVCGRLMCCLGYENDFYKEMQKIVPRTGKTVNTPQGKGRVIVADYLKSKVTVDLGDGAPVTFEAGEVELVTGGQQTAQTRKSGGEKKNKDNNPPQNLNNKKRNGKS